MKGDVPLLPDARAATLDGMPPPQSKPPGITMRAQCRANHRTGTHIRIRKHTVHQQTYHTHADNATPSQAHQTPNPMLRLPRPMPLTPPACPANQRMHNRITIRDPETVRLRIPTVRMPDNGTAGMPHQPFDSTARHGGDDGDQRTAMVGEDDGLPRVETIHGTGQSSHHPCHAHGYAAADRPLSPACHPCQCLLPCASTISREARRTVRRTMEKGATPPWDSTPRHPSNGRKQVTRSRRSQPNSQRNSPDRKPPYGPSACRSQG